MNTKNTLLSLLAFLFSFSSILGQAVAITPVRTDVSGFTSWADTSVGGTTYLQLLSATSRTIAPTMDFVAYTAPTLDFKLRTFGGTSGSSNVVTVSISTNNGLTYATLGTRTATSTLLTAVTQFDLSAYMSSQIRIKFESLGATGTTGVGIDDITISGVPGCNAPLTQAAFGNTIPASTTLTQAITAGSGAGRLVLFNSTNSFTDPTNGTAYTANTVYAASGQQVVYSGAAATSVVVSNLSNTTTYYFAIYEYNCSGSTIVYNLIENTTSGITAPGGCTNGSRYPSAIYTSLNNGIAETITTNAFPGEYSVIDIPSTDNVYLFSSSVSTDFITITNSTGSAIYASGVTPLTWTSTVAATIRYYIHLNASCTTSSVARTRYIQTVSTACGSPSSPLAINISSNSASVSWTSPVTAPSSGYEVYYAVASTSPSNTTAGFFTTSNIYFIDSLTSNTTYYYWIRSKCGTAKSPWVAGGTFKTLTTLACNSATYGLYPTTTFSPTYSGVEEQIASDCKTSQYSNVNILANKQYVFKSYYLTDFITITNEAGTVVYASGQTPLTWESGTNSGVVRYYFHSNSNCTSGAVLRAKSITSTTVIPCGIPTGLTAAHITSNSAYISVAAPSSPSLTVSQYYLYINTTGFAPISSTQPTAISSTSPIFVNGLQANTVYYYWVKSNCSSSSSSWVAGGTFTSLPEIYLSCNSATYGLNPMTTFTPAGTGNLELITNSSAASQFSYITISPDKTYTFHSNTGTDYLTITNEAGTTVITKGSSPLTWNSGTTSGTFRYYIHSQVACGSSTSTRSKYVKYVPYCNAPTGISISNIGSQTASFSWASLATGYQCFLSITNNAPSDASGTTDNYTTTNYFNAYGLTPSFTYYAWVRSVCGFGNSSWISAGSFTTLAGGCTSGTLYPNTTFTPAYTGIAETISTQTYAGEYSNVAIQSGKNYMFSSSVSSDYITVTNATGSVIYAYGYTPVTWSSGTNNGTIRYYIHANVACSTQNTNRTRYIFATTPCLTSSPTVSAQSFCEGATVGNLVATGTNIKWYNVPWAGTALTSTTALTTGIYYVTQTVGCESSRLDVSITVNPIITPTFTPIANICAGANLAALPTTSNNGITGTWSPDINNLQTTTYTFTPTQGSCAPTTTLTINVNVTSVPTGLSTQVYADATATLANLTVTGTNINWYNDSTAGTLLPSSTVLIDGTMYYASQTNSNCESPSRLAVTLRAISSATQSICVNAKVSDLVSTPSVGTTANWFSTNSGGFPLASNTDLSNGTYYVEQLTPSFAITSTIGSGIYTPTGVAIQPDGKILVTDNYGLYRMDADGNNKVSLSYLSSLGEIALQADGKILVVDGVNGKVKRFNSDGTGVFSFNGFSYPSGVDVQADGTILVAEHYSTAIKKMNADGTGIVSLGSGFNSPSGIAIQPDGKILIADSGSNTIKRMNPDGTGIVTLGSGFIYPFGVAVQSDGKILVADMGNNSVKRMNADGSGIEILGSGFSSPSGVVAQLDGSIIVADQMNDAIKKIGPGIASNRVAVNVEVNSQAPSANSQSLCGNATVANLIATGTNLKWYSNSTDGSALTSNTALTSGNYYVSQTLGTCESNRTAVSVTINPNVTPSFTQVAHICIGGFLAALPTTSDLGISGTWSPALNNTATTTYTFTPESGQCASSTTMTITVNPNVTPDFAQVAPICTGSSLADLPTTSDLGISGTWSPALNNTATTTYTFTPTTGLCASSTTMTITVNPNVTPEFAQVAPICAGGFLAALPTTSNNGLTGTWSPMLNNTATTTYTFTPTTGLCATSATMTIIVNPNVTPEFAQVAPICTGSSLADLPTTSDLGISGTWSPALNNTTTTTYTFTPESGQCASSTTMTITVNPNVTPEFTQVAPICAGGFLAALPTTSNNGLTGTWSPALNNTATTTYTFTPTAGLCATSTTMTITVNPNVTPDFAQVAPICTGGFLAALPTTSNNGLTGTWSPALNNSATTTYAFTPESSQCATSTTMTITVNPNVTPEFAQVAPICAGGFLAALPTISNNGLTGTWLPALNNAATTTYTFTPESSQCATSTTMTITVNPNITPEFTQVAPICSGASLAVLPTTSNNGIAGTWSPALNNATTTTYTFTPTVGFCATTANLTISVNTNVTPEFAQVSSICAGGFLAVLPTTSDLGISGTWSPAIDNTATTTYTFSPESSQCATTATMTITVNPNVTPEFAQVAPICAGGSLAALPTTSDLGISGTWSPTLNNAATTTYTFTPESSQCATTTAMTITVNPNVTPEFTQVAPICAGSSLSALPTNSNNSITGTWSPAIDNIATTTYTFTPESSLCASSTTMTITVNPNVTPEFAQVAPICAGTNLSTLPTTSNNAITGTWSPTLNNTATTTYTFTPESSQCATSSTMTITVNPTSLVGTVTAVASICYGSATSVSLSGSTGTIQWQKKDAVNTTWSVISSATSAILNTEAITATSYFRAVVTNGVCSSVISNSVMVSVITTPTPTATAQTIPSTATVANLVATGTNLKWYSTASGGASLATTTVLEQGNYYVSQTLNGCESTVRALSTVTLYVIPVSKVITSQCGSTLSSIDANINAEVVAGYQAYRFEVTNGTAINTIELNKYNFSLTQTPGIVYNTAYSVRVAVKMGNVWGAYGATCTITTPLNATVNIVPVLVAGTCGSALLSVSQSIYAESISGATLYRFKVNGLQVIETSNRYFTLNSITGGALFGTAYTIAVSCFVNGTWTSYGAACTVTTPGVAVPGTQMVLCGQSVSVLRQSIYAIQVGGATKYRFRVNGNQVIETVNRYFNLTQVGAVLGASYSIEVACLMSGVSWTPYGSACTIYTPSPTAREYETSIISEFNVIAFPNPFNTAFKVDITDPTKENIYVRVFDMTGKQLENLEIAAAELKNVAIGQNYAAGIYSIIVSQGVNTKTVRLIKK